jgi:hypothetical protein
VAKDESFTTSPRVIALQISSITVSTSSADSVRDNPTFRKTDSARSARVTVFPAIFPRTKIYMVSMKPPEIISLKTTGQAVVFESVLSLRNDV